MRTKAPKKEITIEQWFADQDKAVDAQYGRQQRLRVCEKSPAPVSKPDDGNVFERLLKTVISSRECGNEVRKKLEDDGYNVEALLVVVDQSRHINRIGIEAFESGFFEEKACPAAANYEIKVVKESIRGKRVERIFIDGQPLLAIEGKEPPAA